MYSPYNSQNDITSVSPQYLGYSTNNQYGNFPPLMKDGRASIASYQPEAVRNKELLTANNIKTNFEYRNYLTQNANQIMKIDYMSSLNDVGFYKRYADAPKHDTSSPYLYKSYLDDSKPEGYSNSDLKDLYISREQLQARKVSPIITQEEILKARTQR
jgi:hypothetical protein